MDEDDERLDDGLNCPDENGNYPHESNEVVPQITAAECENLKTATGLDGTKRNNCEDMSDMLCDIKQDVEWLASQRIATIAANEASKCAPSSDPTLASMMSRILRYSQAVACVMCSYDPFIATILKSGRYPQILMGSVSNNGYPTWVNPDEVVTPDSVRPVTSAGIYKAIEDAILSVWHLWAEHPQFDYFAQTLDDPDDAYNLKSQMNKYPAVNGQTALVASGTQGTTLLYTYTGGNWTFTRVLNQPADNLTNFATTHINQGAYATNGVYYFDGTWQVMDADIGTLEARVEVLEKIFREAITSGDEGIGYIITTRPTLGTANAVECNPEKDTIVLITG